MKDLVKSNGRKQGKRRIKGGMVTKPTAGGVIADIVITAIVALAAFICIIPMWHVLMSSISDGYDIYNYSGIALVPRGEVTFGAYKELFAFQDGLLWIGLMNTFIYTFGTVGIGVCINVCAGYALSRKTKLGPVMALLCVFSVMFSGGMAPLYWVVDSLHLTNTYFSVILTECTMGMSMVLAGMAFKSVPEDTVEAARIDGAGHIMVMFQIMLPQCINIFMVTILMTFINSWNSYVGVQLYNGFDSNLYSLQLVIDQFKQVIDSLMSGGTPPYEMYPVQFAGIIFTTLPIMIAMPFFQKQLERGVITGAVKG